MTTGEYIPRAWAAQADFPMDGGCGLWQQFESNHV